MHTLTHTLLRAHAHKLTLVLCLGVTQHLILCAFTPLLWPYNATSGSSRATNTLASCHTRRVSMSRVQLKGPYHQSSLSPTLRRCRVPISPMCPNNWVSLPLGRPRLWCSLQEEMHSGSSVCAAELPESPRSPDNPLILKEHHQLMHPLHKRTDGHLDCFNTA